MRKNNIRKKLNILICSLLILLIIFLVGCKNNQTKVTSVEVIEASIPKEVTYDDFDISDIKLLVISDDGADEIVSVTKDMLSSDALDKLKESGVHYIYIKYGGKIAIATITILDKYPNVLVNFDSCGGSSVKRQVVEKYSLALRPNDPIKAGYNFVGWFTDAELLNQFSFGQKITDNITLYAGWEAVNNVIKFNTNGGNPIENIEVATGDMLILPSDPIRDGYTFDGWYLDKDLTKEYVASNVNSSFTLYAKWNPNIYTIVFEENGGNEIGDALVGFDAVLVEPKAPVRYGYTLEGWYLDRALTIKYDFNLPVRESFTLYAKWVETIYTVKFVTNGGTPIDDIYVRQDEYLPNNISTIKEDSNFGGWYLDSEFSTPFALNTPINSDLTLYAKWIGLQLIVNFDTDGGSEVNSVVVEYGHKVSRPNTPSKFGYIFIGWFSDSEKTIAYNFDNEVVSDITIYAKWIADSTAREKRTVTLYDEAYNVYQVIEVYEGQLLQLPNIEREDLTLEGWYLDPSYEVKYDLTIPVTIDLTLYANFVETYTVTFVDRNGNELEVKKVLAGHSVSGPTPPTISEYDFVGWDHSLQKITSSFTTRPIYELHKYKAVFKVGDTTIQTQYVESGKTPVTPSNVNDYAPVGYVFASWDKELEPIYSDSEFVASFEKRKYTVTFRDYFGTIYEVDEYYYKDIILAPDFNGNDFVTVLDWYTDKSFITRYNFRSEITGNVEVYGKFDFLSKVTYTVNDDEITITNINLNRMSELDIPSSLNNKKVVSIQGFTNYDSLTKVIINANLRSINFEVLSKASNLKEIVVKDNSRFKSVDGILYNASEDTLLLYPADKEGNSFKVKVASVGDYAFGSNKNITKLNLTLVTNIGEYAFKDSHIIHIELGYSCAKATSTFSDTLDELIIIVPASSTYSASWNEDRIYSLSNVINGLLYRFIENDEVEIMEYLGTSSRVIVPDEIEGKDVTTIRSYAFSGSHIRGIELGNNVVTINDNAFDRLELKHLIIKSSLTINNRYLSTLKQMLAQTNVYIKDELYSSYNFTKQYRLSIIDGDFAYQTINGKYGITEYLGDEEEVIIPSVHNDNEIEFLAKDFNDNPITKLILSSEITLDSASIASDVLVLVPDDILDIYCWEYKSLSIYPISIDIRENDDFIYGIYNNKAVIIKIISSLSDLTIPDTIGGAAVTRIGKNALSDNDKVRKIHIGRYVEFVDTFALRSKNSENVLEIIFSSSVAPEINGEICYLTDKIYRENEFLREYGARFKNHVVSVYNQQILENSTYLYAINYKSITIIKYKGNSSEVVIPSEIDNYPVTRIASYAFSGKDITKITVPSSVDYLEYLAFGGVNGLEEVIINATKVIELETIATNSKAVIRVNNKYSHRFKLDNNWENEEVLNLDTLVTTSDGITYYLEDGKAIVIRIDEDIRRYILPTEVDGYEIIRLASFAMYDCQIRELIITGSLDKIGYNALPLSLEKLTFRTDVAPSISEQDANVTIYVDDSYLNNFYSLNFKVLGEGQVDGETSDYRYSIIDGEAIITKYIGDDAIVSIPQSIGGRTVREIGEGAFIDNTTITSVNIPSSVRRIKGLAFYGCSNLSTLTGGSGVTSIGANAFYDTKFISNNTNKLIVIGSVLYKYNSKYDSNGIIAIDSNITEIAPYAFEDATKVSEVAFGNNLTKIGSGAFVGCTNIIEISLPNSLKEIDDDAFSECSRLRTVRFGNKLERIGEFAFSGCDNLSSINITNITTLTIIGDYAFENCTSLTSMNLPSSIEKLGNNAFYGCANLEALSLNNDYYSISDGILYNSDKTKVISDLFKDRNREVVLDSNVKDILDYAFFESNVTRVTISSNVRIYQNAFTYNPKLNEIVFLGDDISEIALSSISSSTTLHLRNDLIDLVKGDEVFDRFKIKGLISYSYDTYTIKVGSKFNVKPYVVTSYTESDISYQILDTNVLSIVNGEFVAMNVGTTKLIAYLNLDTVSSVEITINVVR